MKKLILVIGFALSFTMNAQYVSTLAGTYNSGGFADGTGTPVKFHNPTSVAIDAAGNLFVADYVNNRIRKITPAGAVSTFAGSGVAGFADGMGTAAQFSGPEGVAVDAAGNLFVADSGNNSIRKISASGVVSTLAGSTQGYADGLGAAAKFHYPSGVAVDAAGNVFVADLANNSIRKITASGMVSTFGNYGVFNQPSSVAVDSAGIVYVADQFSHSIRKITNGFVSSFAGGSITGGYTDGVGFAARFNRPRGVAVDASGNVYVADYNNRLIRKITASGVVTTFSGSAPTFYPQGVAVDAVGNVYVADRDNSLILKITAAGTVSTLAGTTQGYGDGTAPAPKFYYPTGVAVDAAGNIFVADNGNHRIRKITASGVVSTLAGSTQGYADGLGAAAQFKSPNGVAVDVLGNVYVADNGNHRIRKITASGVVTTFAGSGIGGYADGLGIAAKFYYPSGVAIDAGGNVYVADAQNGRIRKITSAGVTSTFAGSGAQGFADGIGTAAIFNGPTGVALDAGGNVYVADHWNNRIRKITAAGEVSTLAGQGTWGYADGIGTTSQFRDPYGVTVDAGGNLYVADARNNLIRKITTLGMVSTLAGSTEGYADGIAAEAKFNLPSGVAIDAAGNVFVADTTSCVIRKITGTSLGISEFSDTILKLYPNPTHSLINIQMSNNVVLEKITITDLTGKTVIEQTQNTNQVSVEKLATGVYILNGYSEGNKFQEKFIKE
jgi:sugar lactone lactonase YvrE